jgi:hypothetical protein
MHFIDEEGGLPEVWSVEFQPTGETAAEAAVLTRIDHVAETMKPIVIEIASGSLRLAVTTVATLLSPTTAIDTPSLQQIAPTFGSVAFALSFRTRAAAPSSHVFQERSLDVRYRHLRQVLCNFADNLAAQFIGDLLAENAEECGRRCDVQSAEGRAVVSHCEHLDDLLGAFFRVLGFEVRRFHCASSPT